MDQKELIVEGKVKWKSDGDKMGLIVDQMGRGIVFSHDAIVPMVSTGEPPQLFEGDAVKVVLESGPGLAKQLVLTARKVVYLGKSDKEQAA